MKRIYFLSVFITISLSAMEIEQSSEKCYLEALPTAVQHKIFLHLVNQQHHDWDIKDYYNEVKPFADSNKYYREHIPHWFINFWFNKNLKKEHSKLAIASMCGATSWIINWLKKHGHNRSCKDVYCCLQDPSYQPYQMLYKKDSKGLNPLMNSMVYLNRETVFLLFNFMNTLEQKADWKIESFPEYFLSLFTLYYERGRITENELLKMLTYSVKNRFHYVVDIILFMFKIDENQKKYIQSLLIGAIIEFDHKLLKLAVKYGADLHAEFDEKLPLTLAFAWSVKNITINTSMIEHLLNLGIDPEYRDSRGISFLMRLGKAYIEAIDENNQAIIQYCNTMINLINNHKKRNI